MLTGTIILHVHNNGVRIMSKHPSALSVVLFTWMLCVQSSLASSASVILGVGDQQESSVAVNLTGIEQRFRKPYNICTSEWEPFVKCAELSDPSQYTGYQIELFRLLAKRQGWEEDDYTFHCMDWSPMIMDLLSSDGNCFMAAAGVEVSLDNVRSGLQFSWPIYKSGLMLLTTGSVNVGGLWTFAQAFHWSLWLALGVTGLVGGALLFFAEWLSGEGRKNSQIGVLGWAWYSYAKLVAVDTKHIPSSWASRIIMWAYGLLVLIVVNFFTATSASMLTEVRFNSRINGLGDLPGKPVVTWSKYVNMVAKYGVRPKAMSWEGTEDLMAMVESVLDGSAVALVLDTPVVQYLASSDSECRLFSVGQNFETFSLAMAFAPNFPTSVVTSFSTGIVELQQREAKLDELEGRFITANTAGCDFSGSGINSMQIGFFQVAGLWIILGGAAGFGLLLLVLPKILALFMGPDYKTPHWSLHEVPMLEQLSTTVASRLQSMLPRHSILKKGAGNSMGGSVTDPGHPLQPPATIAAPASTIEGHNGPAGHRPPQPGVGKVKMLVQLLAGGRQARSARVQPDDALQTARARTRSTDGHSGSSNSGSASEAGEDEGDAAVTAADKVWTRSKSAPGCPAGGQASSTGRDDGQRAMNGMPNGTKFPGNLCEGGEQSYLPHGDKLLLQVLDSLQALTQQVAALQAAVQQAPGTAGLVVPWCGQQQSIDAGRTHGVRQAHVAAGDSVVASITTVQSLSGSPTLDEGPRQHQQDQQQEQEHEQHTRVWQPQARGPAVLEVASTQPAGDAAASQPAGWPSEASVGQHTATTSCSNSPMQDDHT